MYIFLSLIFLILLIASAVFLIEGSIQAIKTKTIKPLKLGMILIVMTISLFFSIVIAGQIFSQGQPSTLVLPALE